MPEFPYTSWFALNGTLIVILSMPFILGQGSGLAVGIVMIALYSLAYEALKFFDTSQAKNTADKNRSTKGYNGRFAADISEELTDGCKKEDKNTY